MSPMAFQNGPNLRTDRTFGNRLGVFKPCVIAVCHKWTDFRSSQSHIGPPPAGRFTEAQLNAVFTTEGGTALW